MVALLRLDPGLGLFNKFAAGAPARPAAFFRAEEQFRESAMTPYVIAILLTILTFPKTIALIAICTLAIADRARGLDVGHLAQRQRGVDVGGLQHDARVRGGRCRLYQQLWDTDLRGWAE